MNTKKLIGLAIVLVALLFPLNYSVLSTEGVGNMTGLISFVLLITGLLAGYFIIDSSDTKKATDGHDH